MPSAAVTRGLSSERLNLCASQHGKGSLILPYLAVAIGGLLGALARYGISLVIQQPTGFPLATLLINLTGSLFLTWFYTITQERVHIHPHLRLGVGTGLVGAFTTFSTFTVEAWELYTSGRIWEALLYLFLSIVGGLSGAFIGYRLAIRQSSLRFADSVSEDS